MTQQNQNPNQQNDPNQKPGQQQDSGPNQKPGQYQQGDQKKSDLNR